MGDIYGVLDSRLLKPYRRHMDPWIIYAFDPALQRWWNAQHTSDITPWATSTWESSHCPYPRNWHFTLQKICSYLLPRYLGTFYPSLESIGTAGEVGGYFGLYIEARRVPFRDDLFPEAIKVSECMFQNARSGQINMGQAICGACQVAYQSEAITTTRRYSDQQGSRLDRSTAQHLKNSTKKCVNREMRVKGLRVTCKYLQFNRPRTDTYKQAPQMYVS